MNNAIQHKSEDNLSLISFLIPFLFKAILLGSFSSHLFLIQGFLISCCQLLRAHNLTFITLKMEKSLLPQVQAPTYGNLVTILSIDGGGIRGIIPATILACLESHLQV